MTREEAIKILSSELNTRSEGYNANLVYGGKYDKDEEDSMDALYFALSALREQESAENAHCNSCKKCNDWIPVTERLPDKCTIVLCYKEGQRRLGYYLGANYSKGVAAFRHPKDQWAFGVTHWMPLPEPPEV